MSKAADVLLISQPSLTRNMQMLEDELGVILFERRKNKLSFTETGHQTVKLTQKFLKQKQKFLDDVQHFALKESIIFGGVNAPGAIFELESRIKEKGLEQHIQIEQKTNDELEKALDDENVHFIVTDYPIKKEHILSMYLFMEQLYLSVPLTHPYATRKEIKLAELANLTMLLRSDLGIWQPLVNQLTQTKFIVQKDRAAFVDLVNASALPTFSTNITQQNTEESTVNSQRIQIPISDKEATKTFYISVLKKNKAILQELVKTK